MTPIMRQILSGTGIPHRGLLALNRFNDIAGSQVLHNTEALTFTNGSDVGADTNDVTFDGVKGVFGGDDYIESIRIKDSFRGNSFHWYIVLSTTNKATLQCVGEIGDPGMALPSVIGLYIEDITGKPRIYTGWNGSTYPSVTLDVDITDGQYHLLEGAADAGANYGWVNNMYYKSALGGTGALVSNNGSVMYGKNKDSNNKYFTGNIAYSCLFKRKLTQAERLRVIKTIRGEIMAKGLTPAW